MREARGVELAERAGLELRNPDYEQVSTTGSTDGSWYDDTRKICDTIKAFLSDNAIPLAPQQTKRSATGTARINASTLTDIEKSYLERSFGIWLKGQIDTFPVDDHTPYKAPYLNRTLFEFDTSRYLALEGVRLVRGEDTDQHDSESGVRRRKLLKYIFEWDKSPVVLLGTAGAGKSTTSSMIATLCAGRIHPTIVEDVDFSRFEADVIDFALNREKEFESFMPVIMRCTKLAEQLSSDRKGFRKDRIAFENAILQSLSSDEQPTAEAREYLAERMTEQSFMVILDGLDEVIDDQLADRILDLARGFYARRESERLRIRVLISSRPSDRSFINMYQVAISELRLDQIERYFQLYADSVYVDSNDVSKQKCAKFLQVAREQFSSYNASSDKGDGNRSPDNMERFLSRPFNLNCFCWLISGDLARRQQNAPLTETAFFRKIIERLIAEPVSGIVFDEIPITPDVVRTVLQRLAYNALYSDGEKGQLNYSTALEHCFHTLSVVMAYRKDSVPVTVELDHAERLLNMLCSETDLLVRNNYKNIIEFGRIRFCEYLAGERIDSDALVSAMLAMMEIHKLDVFLPSLRFCYALRLERGVVEYATHVPEGLLDRASKALNSSMAKDDRKSADTMLQWLGAALKCMRGSVENDFGENALYEPDQSSYKKTCNDAINLLKQIRGRPVNHKYHTEAVSNLLRLGRRPKPGSTVTEVRELAGKLVEMYYDKGQKWADYEITYKDGSTRIIEIDYMPVLVCEYEEFLEQQAIDLSDAWDHAPDAFRVCIDKAQPGSNDDWYEKETWRALRREPGNPMIFVTWYEAVAYAKWMTARARADYNESTVYRLPTVYEMEQICFHIWGDTDYPWLPGQPMGHGVNWRGYNYGGTTPMGVFPAQDRILDLRSNVRSWAVPEGENGEATWPPLGQVSASDRQEVYGGAWIDTINQFKRGATPMTPSPANRENWIGIRLVRDSELNVE